jgi:putative spermidine/putrescine transport system ATP-binding protein
MMATANSSFSSPRAGHLVISGLQKRYQDHAAVAGVDLDVAPGEFVALLGPSGCGKTTVLRSIAGLVSPTAGDIRIDSRSILADPVYKRDLGMVFQSYALFPHMTVKQNVAFGLRMRGVSKEEMTRRADESLELVRMQAYAERFPAQLSGGQQQRVALARAIITNPTVLLLDEPFSALDAKLRESMQIELRQLQRRLRITTIFVTHDQQEALTMADRIAVMNTGRVEQFGTPQAIYNAPQTLFVAEFIGRMNSVPGRLIGRESGHSLVCLEGRKDAYLAKDNAQLGVGDVVVAALRPEKIALLAPGSGVNGYTGLSEGKVSEVIFKGGQICVYLETIHGQLMVAAQSGAHGNGVHVSSGDTVRIGWNASDMLVFPAG